MLRRQAAAYKALEDWEVNTSLANSQAMPVPQAPRGKRCLMEIEADTRSGEQGHSVRRHVCVGPSRSGSGLP